VRIFALSLFLLLIRLAALAQNPSSGIIFGLNAGASRLVTEFSSGFKESVTEFDNKAGFAADLEVSKLLFNHFEVGTSINLANLKGDTDDPQFSAEGLHFQMMEDIVDPVEYINQLVGQKFFAGYYFRSFSKIKETWQPEPFIRAGIGYIHYSAELRYQDPALGLIFGKGIEGYDYNLSTLLYSITAGVKVYAASNFFINTTYTLNYTNYDFLDVVHNYSSDGTFGDFNGIYSEFKVGIFFQTKGKGNRSASSGARNATSLPFAR
jgi:hypothetical protein